MKTLAIKAEVWWPIIVPRELFFISGVDPDFQTLDPDFESRDFVIVTRDSELQSRDPEIKK